MTARNILSSTSLTLSMRLFQSALTVSWMPSRGSSSPMPQNSWGTRWSTTRTNGFMPCANGLRSTRRSMEAESPLLRTVVGPGLEHVLEVGPVSVHPMDDVAGVLDAVGDRVDEEVLDVHGLGDG